VTGAGESYRLATYNIESYISIRSIMERRYVTFFVLSVLYARYFELSNMLLTLYNKF
jgi:hypothetical protein